MLSIWRNAFYYPLCWLSKICINFDLSYERAHHMLWAVISMGTVNFMTNTFRFKLILIRMKVKNVYNTYLGSPSYESWKLINFVLDYLHSNFAKKVEIFAHLSRIIINSLICNRNTSLCKFVITQSSTKFYYFLSSCYKAYHCSLLKSSHM